MPDNASVTPEALMSMPPSSLVADTVVSHRAGCHFTDLPLTFVARPWVGGDAGSHEGVTHSGDRATKDTVPQRDSGVNAPQPPQYPRFPVPLPPGYLPGVV